MAPMILTFSIAMDANYSSYVKFIATSAATFLGIFFTVLPGYPLCLRLSPGGAVVKPLLRSRNTFQCQVRSRQVR